jgi:hypothetical protein
MASTINASTSSGIVQSADTSGVLTLQSDGTTKMSIGSSITMNTGGLITSGTAVSSTSGTSIDFTGIPSWVKRITVMYSQVSTNGTSSFLVQFGTSGGIQTTGYDAVNIIGSQGSANTVTSSTAGFLIFSNASQYQMNGSVIFTLLTGSTWVAQGVSGSTNYVAIVNSTAGTKTLSGTLDRVRFTTVNGTDAFDNGTINILYEG